METFFWKVFVFLVVTIVVGGLLTALTSGGVKVVGIMLLAIGAVSLVLDFFAILKGGFKL